LLDNGGDVDLPDHFEFPPIFLAIRHAQPDVLLRILAHNADKNVLSKGDTALHCAVREDAVTHAELLISYGYLHDAVNQDQLTSIQLAQKLGRTRMLCVLDNPTMRQRLLMNPKPQLPNRKVEPPVEPVPEPVAKPVEPPKSVAPIVKKEKAKEKPKSPAEPVKTEEIRERTVPPPQFIPNPPPSFAQNPPTGFMPPMFPGYGGGGGFSGYPQYQGGYVPYQYPMGIGQVYVPVEEFASLQRRLLLLEQATAHLLNGQGNGCCMCRIKVGTNCCPSCGRSFCTPDWVAHVAHGCKEFL
jgi:hypothetical protein